MQSDIFTLLGMLLTLVAILVLAYISTRYVAKFKLGKLMRTKGGGGHMQVLDQLAIGQDARLLLVTVGDRFLLLGHSASGISLLAELTAQEAERWLLELAQQTQATKDAPSFRDSLLEVLKQRKQ
ncbi:MAG: fliO [Firmicutes bacterium]|nr:fliO [Bacillota bacterium]